MWYHISNESIYATSNIYLIKRSIHLYVFAKCKASIISFCVCSNTSSRHSESVMYILKPSNTTWWWVIACRQISLLFSSIFFRYFFPSLFTPFGLCMPVIILVLDFDIELMKTCQQREIERINYANEIWYFTLDDEKTLLFIWIVVYSNEIQSNHSLVNWTLFYHW